MIKIGSAIDRVVDSLMSEWSNESIDKFINAMEETKKETED